MADEEESKEIDVEKENKAPKTKRKRKRKNKDKDETEPPKKKQKRKKTKRKVVKCEDCDVDVKISRYDYNELYDMGFEIYCNKCMKEQGCETCQGDKKEAVNKKYSRCARCGATICARCKVKDGGYCWSCAGKYRRRGEKIGKAVDPLIHMTGNDIIGPIKQSEYNKEMVKKGFEQFNWDFEEN